MSELAELRLALRNAIQERETLRIERDAALRVVEAARYWAHKPDTEHLTTWKSARDMHLSRALRAWEAAQAKEQRG